MKLKTLICLAFAGFLGHAAVIVGYSHIITNNTKDTTIEASIGYHAGTSNSHRIIQPGKNVIVESKGMQLKKIAIRKASYQCIKIPFVDKPNCEWRATGDPLAIRHLGVASASDEKSTKWQYNGGSDLKGGRSTVYDYDCTDSLGNYERCS